MDETAARLTNLANRWAEDDTYTQEEFAVDVQFLFQGTRLRDQFALAAMQGMLAACHGPAWGNDVFPLAESAYAYADQMLKARTQC